MKPNIISKKMILEWLESIRESSHFSANEMPISESEYWKNVKGFLQHRTGRFFKIIGVKWNSPSGRKIEQPLIDQREIGTLGIIVRNTGKQVEALMQAKIEPGNIDIVQLSPTCQATYSNVQCVHGGKKPPYGEFFDRGDSNIKYDLLQSEQGTRFYRKRNRNVLALLDKRVVESKYHRWINVDLLLSLLKENFLVNTDTRSVLVSCPWNLLIKRDPFSRSKEKLGVELSLSFRSVDLNKVKSVKRKIDTIRSELTDPEVVRLDGIKWDSSAYYQIKHIKVKTKGREVSSWDQPILESKGKGMIILPCGRENGVLKFLFKVASEPGLLNKAELTPYILVEPGEKQEANLPTGDIIASVEQSEEGGRFYQDINKISILDIGLSKVMTRGIWLSLGEIRFLLNEEGWFTNEARTALSLLLTWL